MSARDDYPRLALIEMAPIRSNVPLEMEIGRALDEIDALRAEVAELEVRCSNWEMEAIHGDDI